MLPSLILLAYLSTSALAQTPTLLPEYMLGEYVLETSEGFDDYMWQLGVNWFTRKVRECFKKKKKKLGFLAEVWEGRSQRGFERPNLLYGLFS